MPDLKPGYNPIRSSAPWRGHPPSLRAKRSNPGSGWNGLLRRFAPRNDGGKRRSKTMFEKDLLAGKRIFIPGGGSGLGAAMGRRFIELGAELIICGRRLELLEATAAEMRRDPGGKVAAIKCDIRDGAAVDAMLDAIWRDAPLDVLVNNAAATFIAQTDHLSFGAAHGLRA